MASKILRSILRSNRATLILKRWESSEKRLVTYDPFQIKPKKDKSAYLEVIKMYEDKTDHRRRGHVEFIYAALARMKEFGVHKDLEVYKALIDVLPKGKMIPANIFQAEFMHYPKQQQCAVDLLEQMEDNRKVFSYIYSFLKFLHVDKRNPPVVFFFNGGVMPDSEMEQQLLNTFGRRGIPLRKFWRMMYWMPKFKNLSPWHLPDKLPADTLELAILAIQRITSVDADTKVEVWQTEEIEASLDKTWVVSAQSQAQQVLLAEQPPDEPLVVRGPYTVYLRDQVVTYFTLLGKTRSEPIDDRDPDDVSNLDKPLGIPGYIGTTKLPSVKCTVHEQDDGTIVSVCATGTSSRDSLLSWIRLLERHGNPILSSMPVIFTLTAPPSDVSLYEENDNEQSGKKKSIDTS